MSERVYRCSAAARWLPRMLAGSLLATSLIVASQRTATAGRILAIAGAVGALWIVRQGGELRQELSVDPEGLVFGGTGRSWRLDFDRIDSVGFAPPFASMARPFPAALLIDTFGKGHRVSALIEDGGRLVEGLVERSGRDDLRAWVEARGVVARMRHAPIWIAAGYALVAAMWVGALVVYLR